MKIKIMVNSKPMIDEPSCDIEYLRDDIEKGLGRTKGLKDVAFQIMTDQVVYKFGLDVTKWPSSEIIVDFIVKHYKGRFG